MNIYYKHLGFDIQVNHMFVQHKHSCEDKAFNVACNLMIGLGLSVERFFSASVIFPTLQRLHKRPAEET